MRLNDSDAHIRETSYTTQLVKNFSYLLQRKNKNNNRNLINNKTKIDIDLCAYY